MLGAFSPLPFQAPRWRCPEARWAFVRYTKQVVAQWRAHDSRGWLMLERKGCVDEPNVVRTKAMKLKDILTKNPEVISPEAMICEAARKMKDCDIGMLPVCDGE